jgi:hypothetical protein
MQKFIMTAVLGIAFAVAVPAQAACEYPADVALPDGAKATEAEMNAGSAVVKKYIADMDAYMACLDAEQAALPVEQQTPENKALHVKRHNAAVDAEEAIAARFNEQVRAYKAARK